MKSTPRLAGILLHISSLPNNYGIGSLGKCAYQFVDYLQGCNMGLWQVLPLVPTSYGDSPYQSACSTALNQYFIDLDMLIEQGLLTASDVQYDWGSDDTRVDYEKLYNNRFICLCKAFDNYKPTDEYKQFIAEKKYYDYALFMAIKQSHGGVQWSLWQEPLRNRHADALASFCQDNARDIEFWQWTQFVFLQQWTALKEYANSKRVKMIGDMPIYVAYDSVEVWSNPQMFLLDEDKNPTVVAGCPPDCFTEDGQLWGNPIFDWQFMKDTDYRWWNMRIDDALSLFDYVRIDHFRGFSQYYAIPYGNVNARIGQWQDGCGFDLFQDKLDKNIIVEDLGFIDDAVRQLVAQTGYPSMRVLEFAFDGNVNNEHKPTNIPVNCVAYTGTHDNMPLYQYIEDLSKNDYDNLLLDLPIQCQAFNIECNTTDTGAIVDTITNLLYASKANFVLVPMQDMLHQGVVSRMNLPATLSTNNWSYRTTWEHFSIELQDKIKALVSDNNRLPA